MVITFSTVVNIILFSGIAIILLHYIVDKSEVLLLYGIRVVHILMIMVLLRLFLPIELPTQNNINITNIWPDIYIAFTKPFINFAGKEWSLQSFFIIISVSGSIFLTMKLFISYSLIRYAVKYFEPLNNSFVSEIVDTINAGYKKPVHFEIVHNTEINTPLIFGLWKPFIILPDLDLTKDEWYYVLYHEMSHYYFKDLWVRFICELMQALYWWNPFVYVLRRQITKVQELRVDSTVISKLNNLNKLDYMECLIRIARLHKNNQKKWIAAFSSDSEKEVSGRIELIFKNNEYKGRHTIKSGLLALLLVFVIAFLPNFFIIEPFSMAEKDQNKGIQINSANAYYILNADGTYDVYVNSEYFGTVREIFDDSIKIYDERGGENR